MREIKFLHDIARHDVRTPSPGRINPITVGSNIMLSATRSTRRNIARMNHELNAWKDNRNRVRIQTTGQHYVPVPLQTTSQGNK